MKKKVKIDFYRVGISEEVNKSSITFENIIEKVGLLPIDDGDRNLEIRGVPIRMHSFSRWQQLWEVDMIRIRMNRLPVKASLTGSLQPISLDDDEGIGEETAFLYDPKTQIIVVQHNRFGVSASAISRFFQEKSGVHAPITLFPIIKGDALERLKSMNSIYRMEVSVAGVNNIVAQNDNYGVGKTIDLANDFDAPTISVALSMGHYKGSLSLRNVLRSTYDWLTLSNHDGSRLRKLEISGKDETNEKEVIDLLEYRVREEIEIQEHNRRLLYESRQQALRTAWQRQKSLLSS